MSILGRRFIQLGLAVGVLLVFVGPPSVAMEDQEVLDYVTLRIAELLELHDIPGAAVAVVRGGEIVMAEGVGLADAATGRPIDADTLFLLASTSKLFVTVAVLQLVEQGLVDLDDDVNEYLETLRVPETYAEPITLAHLLTHTAGFEDMDILPPGAVRTPLGEYLATNMPDRVRPPGVAPAYSNYGMGLAAFVVEQVSGVPFGEYAATHIFGPLGMASTTYDDPLPDELAARCAVGYGYADDRWIELPDDVPARINLAPVGEARSSASDMARFMSACLETSASGPSEFLGDAMLAEMLSPQFRMDDRFAGMCYGFHERIEGGVRLIYHGGDSLTFHTALILVPEEDLGVFVAFNGVEGVTARVKLMLGLHDQLAATEPDESTTRRGFGNAARCEGDYLTTRRKYDGSEGLAAWWKQTLTFKADDRGRLYRPQAPDAKFAEVEPLVFDEIDGPRTIVFCEGADGVIDHMFLPEFPLEAYERLSGWRTPRFVKQVVGAAVICVGVVLAAILF